MPHFCSHESGSYGHERFCPRFLIGHIKNIPLNYKSLICNNVQMTYYCEVLYAITYHHRFTVCSVGEILRNGRLLTFYCSRKSITTQHVQHAVGQCWNIMAWSYTMSVRSPSEIWLIDLLVFSANFSSISAISLIWDMQITHCQCDPFISPNNINS